MAYTESQGRRERWAVDPERRWELRYPELGTGPIPIEPYVSPKYFDLECDRIFRRVWLNLGRVEEIPQPGDYFIKNIAAAQSSILVVRGRDGVIRGFHNMCSHRGNKIAYRDHGRCQQFDCNFHGWSYGLDGQLLHVPDESQFCQLHKGDLGLAAVATETWEGFIFVNLNPKPHQDLASYLGELGEGLRGWPFADKTACFAYKAEVNCNWKVFINAFQEAYHVPFVHKRSVAPAGAGPGNPLGRALHVILYPLHQTLSVHSNPDVKLNPVEQLVIRYGRSYRQRIVASTDLPPGLNQTHHANWGFDIEVIFPNLMMLIFGGIGVYFTFNFWPLAVDRTLWELRMYNPPPLNAAQRFGLECNRITQKSALCEDLSTLETQQSALSSRAKTHLVLQDNEILIRHLYTVVDKFVRSTEE
jgi:phenylpropionate dioxygenase-like ring-hydroxylating dioxygenase large terminal subunit